MEEVAGTLAGEFWHNVGGQTDVGTQTALLALVYLSVGLRIWSRSIQKASYQLNDWLIFIATILMSARYALEVTVAVKCGLGLHIADVLTIGGPETFLLFLKLVYAIDLLFVTIVAVVKVSILHFYSVIFRQRTFVRIAYATMGICTGFWLASLFATAFVCTPPQKKWYPDIPGHCGDGQRLNFGIATTDFILDIITFVLPLPILWKLQLPFAKKVGLSLVFGLGLSIIVVTAVRFKYFFVVTDDITFTIWPEGVLSAVVPLLGIINANLPVMQPALKRVFGGLKILATGKGTSVSASGISSSRPFKRMPEDGICLSTVEAGLGNNQSRDEDGQIRVTTHWEVE